MRVILIKEILMSIAARHIYSPNDLLSLPDAQNCELIDGELVEKNMSVFSRRSKSIFGLG
jgi:hypothetical protein